VAETADSLSTAFLLVLERLSPVQRAVFLLHDVFGYGYGDIAAIVGRSQASWPCAAAATLPSTGRDSRCRGASGRSSRPASSPPSATANGDIDGLVTLLADDVVVCGDGGSPSRPRPIAGTGQVSRLITALGRQIAALRTAIRPVEINGQPGALFLDPAGRLISALVLDIAGGQVRVIRSVINPGKLRHLGPLADVGAQRRQQRQPD
jgi:RNA polymerase sigma-70 factor (ECF subfamily)